MNRRFWLALLLLAVVAGVTSWLLRSTHPQAPVSLAPTGHAPDYYLTGATVTRLDKQGKPLYKLRSDRIVHHPDDDSKDLSNIRLDYTPVGGIPWRMTANSGHIPSGDKILYLHGKVLIHRVGINGQEPLEIATDDLEVVVDDSYAKTADAVTITQGTNITTAVGMQAWLKQDRIKLESDVKSRFVTPATGQDEAPRRLP